MTYKIQQTLIMLLLLLINFIPITSTAAKPKFITLKILGINDFHGQISKGRLVNNQPVGGAAVLAAYLRQAQSGMEDRTLITIMGDQVGASPPASALLHDEPAILFTNSLGNRHCSPAVRMNPLCNIVATVGNHEFDKGQQAMFDLMYGTNNPPTDNWIPLPSYPGAAYPYISANIIDKKTEKNLFPPYTIKLIDDIPVAFIGAVLKNAADSMFPAHAEGVTFIDEATAINHYIPEIKAQGAQIIIVLIHEGGNQKPYEDDTKSNSAVEGRITEIVGQLDDSIDVVMGGHTHQFLNAFIPNQHGVNILVTQANSYSASFAEVTLQVDTTNQKVRHKSARIITTYANRWPGTIPDQQTQQLVQLAEDKVEPLINSPVATVQSALLREQNDDGESNMGNLVADAYRAVMNTDIGLTNAHGMRDDISPGIITWGTVYSVLPFANNIVSVSLTGQDIYDLLEQQWMGSYPNMLQVSGLSYTYNQQKPVGHKIITILYQDQPLIREKTYTIATTDFLANGSGLFSVMKKGRNIQVGRKDYDTVIQYMKQLPQPFSILIEGRIKKIIK